jgi:hypothetical protein
MINHARVEAQVSIQTDIDKFALFKSKPGRIIVLFTMSQLKLKVFPRPFAIWRSVSVREPRAKKQSWYVVSAIILHIIHIQSRPFGVALLIAGVDEKGPQL